MTGLRDQVALLEVAKAATSKKEAELREYLSEQENEFEFLTRQVAAMHVELKKMRKESQVVQRQALEEDVLAEQVRALQSSAHLLSETKAYDDLASYSIAVH